MKSAALYFIAHLLICFSCLSFAQDKNDVLIDSIRDLSFTNPLEAEKVISFLNSKREVLTKSQTDRLVLYHAYHLGVHHKHKERLSLLKTVDWPNSSVSNRIKANQQMTEVYSYLGLYEDAIITANASLSLLDEVEDPYISLIALHALVNIYNSLFLYGESETFASRIVHLGVDSGNDKILCYGRANIAEIMSKSSRYKQFLASWREAEKTCLGSNDALVVAMLRALYIGVLTSQGRFDEAIEYGVEFYSSQDADQGYEYLSTIEHALGKAFLEIGDFEQSKRFLLLAENRLRNQGLDENLREIYPTLFKLYYSLGEFDSSYQYGKLAVEHTEKFARDALDKSMVFEMAKSKYLDFENRLAIAEKNSLEAEYKYKQSLVFLGWSTLACVLLVLTVMGVQRQKSKIKASLETDTLTKVLSRVSLMESCTKAVAEAKRREQPLSLVVFDLDLFKRVNDTFGHAVGDWVLKTVSSVVRTSIRDKDILGRLGGEEFVICLPNTDIEQARQLSERCREGLERIISPVAIENLDISASFGVARLDDTVDSLDKLLMTADKCLYQAKHLGRNRVVTVLEDEGTGDYKPSMGLCSLQAELVQTPLK
ncbi:tetratricopeptide repeat-containing diguanylate cyclase [Ferrimonas sediminum]|nr:GGDEF domain-containing protein [Ferrimonas sediminum]